ncbi:MAG: hypothetical protein JEY71_14205 [Sphaerochaeta sp.]|nr:hypothetical protein [Sphaerochaeta sp.]
MAPRTLGMVTGYLGTMETLFGILAWGVTIIFLVLCLLFWKVGKGLQWFGDIQGIQVNIHIIS